VIANNLSSLTLMGYGKKRYKGIFQLLKSYLAYQAFAPFHG